MLIYLHIAIIANIRPIILRLIPVPVPEVVLAAFPTRLYLRVVPLTAPLSASSSFSRRLPAMK